MSNVLTKDEGHVRVIQINRPDKLNALNRATIKQLGEQLQEAESDGNIRVIIITGVGEKAFVAGADISEFANYSTEEGSQLSADGHVRLFNLVEDLKKPVIAAVNGFALGGGLELAMSSHIRIASDNAKLGLPEVTLGVIPGYGGTQRLPSLVGRGKANEMIFSGGMISAEEARDWGLVNDVVPQEELMDHTMKLAGKIAGNSPTAISKAIEAVNSGYQVGVDGLKEEIRLFGESFGTEDFKEGTQAFLEKRKPNFTGN